MICFGHENLKVSNLDDSIRFYEENFGMTVRKRLEAGDGKRMAWMALDNTSGFFLELTEDTVVLGNNHIAFVTDERDVYYSKHCSAGLIDTEIKDLGIYFMHDLDGNSIEVMPLSAVVILGGAEK